MKNVSSTDENDSLIQKLIETLMGNVCRIHPSHNLITIPDHSHSIPLPILNGSYCI